VLFYRAHWMAGNLAPIDALVRRIEELGGVPAAGLLLQPEGRPRREGGVPAVFARFLIDERGQSRVDVLISTLSFTVAHLSEGTHTEASGAVKDLLERLDVPVLQAVLCTTSSAEWAGLLRRADPARHGDERRAAGVRRPDQHRRHQLQGGGQFDARLGTAIRSYVPKADRVDFVARLALNFARLRRTPAAENASRSSSATTRRRTPGSATASDWTRPPR
jgi:cobaltochelatase CobN